MFNADADPCADAVCSINHFCRYSNRWEECFCTNPWTGPSCVNTQYRKNPILLVNCHKINSRLPNIF